VGGGIGTVLVVLAAAAIWPQLAALGPLASLRPLEKPEERAPAAAASG
jgi:hypothetical protein